MKTLSFLLLTMFVGLMPKTSFAHEFMPRNNLHLNPYPLGGVNKEAFEELIDRVQMSYSHIFAFHNAELIINRLWNNELVNASAEQRGDIWTINLYGGMARRLSEDAFTLVICHELGHHLGGAVIKPQHSWAANEGQSDYFATLSCVRKLWQNQIEKYEESQQKLSDIEGGPAFKQKCDRIWQELDERQICYRSAVAAQDLADLLAQASSDSQPSMKTTDKTPALQMVHKHPKPQCRLDTYLAGSLCSKTWLDTVIPGKQSPNPSALSGLMAAKPYNCHSFDSNAGFRPNCWFKEPENPIIEFRQSIELSPISPGEERLVRSLNVSHFDTLNIHARGRHFELLAHFNQIPDDQNHSCHSRVPLLPKICLLEVPGGMKWAHIVLKGADRAKPHPMRLDIAMTGLARFCHDYEGGVGEKFPCYEDLFCKTLPEGSMQKADTWCIDY